MARHMRRLNASLCLLIACGGSGSSSGGFPPAVVPPRPSASEWPDVGAIVLEDVAELDYRMSRPEEGSPKLIAVLEHRRRIKILTEDGLAEARMRFPIDGYSTVSRIEARSVSASGDVHDMSPGQMRAVALEGAAAKASDLKELVIAVPGASVGGVIDVRYQRVYTVPELVPVWVFGGRLPTVRSELALVHDEGVKIDYRYGIGEEARDVQPLRRKGADGRDRVLFVERELPAFYPEPHMPHLSRIAPWLAPVVTVARLGEQRLRLETWKDVAARVTEMFAKVGGEVLSGTPESRYRQVRDKLVGLDLPGLGVRTPIASTGLLYGEPACTRDAAALLLKAFEGSEAKFFPAFLTAPIGPRPIEGLPGLYPFVRAVVAVDVSAIIASDPTCREDPVSRGLLCSVPENSYAFLDPACAHCRFGELPTELTGGRALVVLPKGPVWVDVPDDPPERNRAMTQYRLQLDVDGTMQGKMNGEITGVMSRELRGRLAKDASASDAALAAALFGAEPAAALTESSLKPLDRADKPLRVEGKLAAKLEKLGYEDFRINPQEVLGPAVPGRWRATRRYPAVLPAPAWIETVATIDLPVGYKVEEQPITKIVKPFAEYAAGFGRRDRTLNFSRRVVLKRHILSPEEWREFREFVEEIEAIESKGVRAWLER
jgi:hypothetical protein